MDRHINLSRPTSVYTWAESVADHLFPSPDGRFHFGTLIISRGLLPGHAAILSNTPQVAIALGRCGVSLAAGDRRDVRRRSIRLL
jgi:hypothetical protein